jgi:hypothetical protein
MVVNTKTQFNVKYFNMLILCNIFLNREAVLSLVGC